MAWSDLRKWVFLRGLLSGAVLGGSLGSFIFPIVGTIFGMVIGFILGAAVGVSTSMVLCKVASTLIQRYPNCVLTKWLICILFVFLNMAFTIILLGGIVAISSFGSTNERIIRMFNISIIPALLSAIPAIYYTPSFTDKVMLMRSGINARMKSPEDTKDN